MLSKVCIDTEILDILTGSELKLFMIVNSYDEGLGAYVSPNKISKDHNIPLRTVYNQIESLKKKGVLRFEKEDINGSSVKVWKWDFANYGKNDENADEQRSQKNDEKEIAQNGTVCSSSFKYKNTTTTYVAKNGKKEIGNRSKIDKSLKREAFANYGKTAESLFKDVEKLIHISKRVFEKAVRKYPIDEVKKAVVYTYRRKPQNPESYFMMTLAREWVLDVKEEDFDIEVKRIETRERAKEEKIKKMELRKIEEETRKRQEELEMEKMRMLEEKLMNGEMPVSLERVNKFAKDRLNLALRKKDYKMAALHLMPYVQDEAVEQYVINNV